MEKERIERAIARIEAAAARIETAASDPAPPQRDSDLAMRHENLKREARMALSELDGLIGTLEG